MFVQYPKGSNCLGNKYIMLIIYIIWIGFQCLHHTLVALNFRFISLVIALNVVGHCVDPVIRQTVNNCCVSNMEAV